VVSLLLITNENGSHYVMMKSLRGPLSDAPTLNSAH
jgi:hypothetical protein